jgi:hypothetical protein
VTTDLPDTPEIEVGAAGDDLRYWKAKEAVRQGEARLVAQATVRTALEARATAITGWAAVSLLAVTGAGFAAKDISGLAGAASAGLALFAAAALGIHAARPRDWTMIGYDPSVVTSDPLETELEVLESLGEGIGEGIQANNRRLNGMGRMLRWAGWCIIVAPILGGIAFTSASAVTSTLTAFFQPSKSMAAWEPDVVEQGVLTWLYFTELPEDVTRSR